MRVIESLSWLWISIGIVGAIAVIIGVWGEGWVESRVIPYGKSEHLKKISWRILMVGLSMDLIGLIGSTLTSVGLEARVEGLRKENLLLEASIQPRRITPDQRLIILNELGKNLPQQRCRVLITFEDFDVEPRIFAQEIRTVLEMYFRNIEIQSQMVSFSGDAPPVTGVFLAAHNPPPPGAREILKAFIDAGVFRKNTVFDPAPDDGTLRISVWPKPLQ